MLSQNKKSEDNYTVINTKKLGFKYCDVLAAVSFPFSVISFLSSVALLFTENNKTVEKTVELILKLIFSLMSIGASSGLLKRKIWGLYLTYVLLVLGTLGVLVELKETSDIIIGLLAIFILFIQLRYFYIRRDCFNGGSKQKNETSQSPLSFKDNGNGTITDLRTGLMWTKDADLAGVETWQGGLDYVASMNMFAVYGHTDWRLPDIDELKSLVKDSYVPYVWLISQGFTNVQSDVYWSSTTYAHKYCWSGAWRVYMRDGYVYAGDRSYDYSYVWPVRSGQ
ncbi:MAG: DUF1566 domain-containing protein [Nitrospirae bacterium]|nr:DUF1566 domain-containing protein [Nitrospirota bacterium]